MLSAIKLALRFDAVALRADVDALAPEEWIAHFNTAYYTGEWSGVALRSVGGAPGKIYPDPNPQGSWADTEALRRCGALADAIDTFETEKLSVRLLRLGPGAAVREHTDYQLGFDDGEVRFHLPIETNPAAEFVVEGRALPMEPGESWYADFNLPHRVANNGTTARVHLVIDCRVNDWVRETLEAGTPY